MALTLALVIALGSVLAGGVLATRGAKMDVAEWTVGGRNFGAVLFWFLLVGETFTTFALLGASGAVFSNGAPGFYVLGTVVLYAAVGYWILPRIWTAGKRNGLLSMGDFFTRRYGARWLGAVIAIFGCVTMLMYVRIQLTGLGLILQNLLGIDVPPAVYIASGAAIVAVFVFAGGLRSAAFVSVVKDVGLIVALLVVAYGAAEAAGAGSIAGVFQSMHERFPEAATLPGIDGGPDSNLWWWMTFLALTPATFAMPHQFQVAMSAKDVGTIRRNQVVQPLYSLFYIFIIYIAYASVLVLPRLADDAANQSMLIFVHENFPPVVIGVLAGVAILVALVPTAVLMLTAASLFTRNVLGARGERGESMATVRISVVVFTVLAVLLSISSSEALVSIIEGMYSAASQLAPAVVLSLVWRRCTAPALAAGVVAGGLVVAVPALGDLALAPFPVGTVVGIPALVVNLVAVFVVSRFTAPPSAEAIEVGIPAEVRTAARQPVPAEAAK